MEPPHAPPHAPPKPQLPNPKLRLMCSYGGQILPRPHHHHNKSSPTASARTTLFYAGGETRIVSVDRQTTAATLSALTAHLSRTLFGNRPFSLKYQLPSEDLDSLISITTDEDLYNMLEEHDRVCTPSRIRLFLFPAKPESVGSVLLDPKSETWFSDALKSTININRGLSDGAGLGAGLAGLEFGCGPESTNSGGNGNSGDGGDGKSSVQESLLLETCSSFGSTNSSVSMSNLPPIGVGSEDGGGGASLGDKKVKIAATSSNESDNCAATVATHPKTGTYQGELLHPSAPGMTVASSTTDSESIIYDPASTIHMQKITQVSGYHLPHLPDQKHQNEVHYIQPAPRYIQQYPPGPYQASTYYPMYRPYQPSQPYPVYLMPVRPNAQSYNMPDPAGSLSFAPLHPHTTIISQQTLEPTSEHLKKGTPTTPFDNVPFYLNPQHPMGLPEMHHSSQSVAVNPIESSSNENEYDNDLVCAQIYKSQPPAPIVGSIYQTMTKASAVQLSDSSVQLHAENVRQQVVSPQPQLQ